MFKNVLTFTLLLTTYLLTAQSSFYFGADLSYVNEMEDCGVRYKTEDGVEQDPYTIFNDSKANLVRLRLWHSPAWYDNLNDGNRYSDLADVKRSIARAKAEEMEVLLDFHLSDTWTDPSRQIVPAAWAEVVDDQSLLQDSLYNYVFNTLMELDADSLLPNMVQVGNETNKGILQSEADDAAGWALDWPRNAALFNTAIRAVREASIASGKDIKVAVHIAGPQNAGWLLDGFNEYGVNDFDVIGLSYYWAWHQPLTIQGAGGIVTQIMDDYPGKEVMIFETGYIWTNESNDSANNIISSVQEGYAPASPTNQKRWLIDLTQEMIQRGATGVIYWEPAWVSSSCRTQWGQGSHQEHATFFDFDNKLLVGGGMDFYAHDYDGLTSTEAPVLRQVPFRVLVRPDARELTVIVEESDISSKARIRVTDMNGSVIVKEKFHRTDALRYTINLPELSVGIYVVELLNGGRHLGARKVVVIQE
jgi:arabinogalactan endo-1,4-beta-galactosidase